MYKKIVKYIMLWKNILMRNVKKYVVLRKLLIKGFIGIGVWIGRCLKVILFVIMMLVIELCGLFI